MGIFNEHSSNQQIKDHFIRGIQGAPGVGFNLTADGNYDMVNKKLTNVGNPVSNTDAATKKYVDDHKFDNSEFLKLDGSHQMTGDLNMNNYKIENLKLPTADGDSSNKKYVDDKASSIDLSPFLKKDGSIPMSGELNMSNNTIDNIKTPTINHHAANKYYVDFIVNNNKPDLSPFLKKDGGVPMTGSLNMNGHKIINLAKPTNNNDAANKKYVDDNKVDGSVFLKLDGTGLMTGNLNMNNNRIYNIPNPSGPKQPTPLAYTDLAYLHVDGSNKMTNHLNMNNKKITYLKTPTSNSDAATKLYVDNKSTNSQDLKKNGSVPMTGSLNMSGHKITNLEDSVFDIDAVDKKYIDDHLHTAQVQPSHYKDEFSYLLSSTSEWTDEITTATGFNIKKIADLPPSKGNFHDYNHKVIHMEIVKNSQGGYKYKMGINFYRLPKNVDYTLCLEILNTDYELWHKSQISVDKGTSRGLAIENVGVKKLSHRFTNSKGQTEFMYNHRIIVNFKKLLTGNPFFLHILVNIPQDGSDLAIYPKFFRGVFIIAYGIVSKVSNIDPDKVFDYHTGFDVKPTQVVYNVDINANKKKILNIALDKGQDTSAATVGMVKELIPFTKNYVYRQYFKEFYYFTDANIYGLNRGASGIVINSLRPSISIPNRRLTNIKEDGLDIRGYDVTLELLHLFLIIGKIKILA